MHLSEGHSPTHFMVSILERVCITQVDASVENNVKYTSG